MWISGLINPYGTPARVIRAVAEHRVTAVMSQHLIDELAEVLARPSFRQWVTLDDAMAFVDALAREGDLQPDPGPPERRLRDPDDEYLVALADVAEAVIVTGDADLLEAGLATQVITPRELVERL